MNIIYSQIINNCQNTTTSPSLEECRSCLAISLPSITWTDSLAHAYTHTRIPMGDRTPEIQMTGKDDTIRFLQCTHPNSTFDNLVCMCIDILISRSTISTRGQPDQQKKRNSENKYEQDAGIPKKGREATNKTKQTSKDTKDTHLHTSLKFVDHRSTFVIGHHNLHS